MKPLPLTADDEVYAVWGYDANEDGTPDVEETDKYSLTYDTNAMEGDTVSGSVSDANEYVSSRLWRWPMAVACPIRNLEWRMQRLCSSVGPRPRRIESSAAAMKIRQLSREVTIVPAVTFDSQDIEVYAVWGYDKDKDDRPDVVGEDYVIYPSPVLTAAFLRIRQPPLRRTATRPLPCTQQWYAVDRIVIDDTTYLNNGKLELKAMIPRKRPILSRMFRMTTASS